MRFQCNKSFVRFIFQGIFLFSLTWSIGASSDANGRVKFNALIRELMEVSLVFHKFLHYFETHFSSHELAILVFDDVGLVAQVPRGWGHVPHFGCCLFNYWILNLFQSMTGKNKRIAILNCSVLISFQGAMTDETRTNLGLVDLTEAPTRPYTVPIPKDGLVYHYQFAKEGVGKWTKWSDELKASPASEIPRDAQFNEIIVPTVDTVRYTQLMKLLVSHQKACLFVGPTGTGKSVYIIVSLKIYYLNFISVLFNLDISFYFYIKKIDKLA